MKKKIIYGIIIFIILVFLIPILINECYLPNKGYLTVWDGADVLSFYGAVLAAFFIAVVTTEYSSLVLKILIGIILSG